MPNLKTRRETRETVETHPLTVNVEGLGPVSLRYRRSGLKSSTLRRLVHIQKSAKEAEETSNDLLAAETVLESLELRAEGLLSAIVWWDLDEGGETIPITQGECQAREDDEAFWEVVAVLLAAIGAAISPNPPTPAT